MTTTNVTPPTISGNAQQGQTLTTTDGTWTTDHPPLSYTYQWLRCNSGGTSCVDIAGATNSSFVLTSADVGHTIRSEVTAHETPPTPSEPAPIAGQGYSVVFQDDFTSLDTSRWYLGEWWRAETPQFFTQSGSSVFLHCTQAAGYPNIDLTARTAAFQYGYFEARMRYTRSIASWAAFWLFSDNWMRTRNCTSIKISEFDMYESNHEYENPTTYRSHLGTLHRNTPNGQGSCGLADTINPWSNAYDTDTGMVLADNWRTYSGLWTPTTVYWYVDEVLLHSYPTFDTTSQPMRPIMSMWKHPNYAAPSELVTEVDWVKIWQQ